jgi:RNA polymerase sigma-70 factor (ECF subfamily)
VPSPRVASAGGDDRWTRLYRTHHAAVYARCRRLLRDHHAAEDAAHETFVRAFQHLDGIAHSDDQRRWLTHVASNFCLNQVRDRKRHAELLLLFEVEATADATGALVARDVAARVALRVPDKVRRVAWLRYVDEMHQHQVAEHLGISRRTVVNRLAAFRVGARRALVGLTDGVHS